MSAVFEVIATNGPARAGTLRLMRGVVNTPVFMPVGTQATVKTIDSTDLIGIGAEIVLGNTYHLMQRPGSDLIERLGGLSRFMGWNRPVLTDSGGFQIFSLARNRRLSAGGVEFRSHIDGSKQWLTPERAIDFQLQLGSDVIMPLDVCVGFDTTRQEQERATELTHGWLPRNIDAFHSTVDPDSASRPLLFGIAQGGFDSDRRRRSSAFIAEAAVDGAAIGGLSVGESKEVMAEMLAASVSPLRHDKPRYLMGVGSPEDLWNAVAQGVDMFDCVLPTRVARHGSLYTLDGRINIRRSNFRSDDGPIDKSCECFTCRDYSAAYLRHLFKVKEPLGFRLASIHNLRFFMRQMEVMRAAIVAGTFSEAYASFISRYTPVDQSVAAEQKERFLQRFESRHPSNTEN